MVTKTPYGGSLVQGLPKCLQMYANARTCTNQKPWIGFYNLLSTKLESFNPICLNAIPPLRIHLIKYLKLWLELKKIVFAFQFIMFYRFVYSLKKTYLEHGELHLEPSHMNHQKPS